MFGSVKRVDNIMNLLIELYTEELPAGYMPNILKSTKKFFRKAVKGDLRVWGTSRRIVIYYKELHSKVLINNDVLANLLLEYVEQLPLPKRMRWDGSGLTFARPIRNLLVIHNNDIVKGVQLGELLSSDLTFFLEGKSLLRQSKKISSMDDYLGFWQTIGVVLDPEKRKELIVSELERLSSDLGCKANIEKDLLEEVVFLTEAPALFVGKFNKKFLELPSEVLITSMAKNQKLFTLSYPDASMAPFFIGVLEGEDRKGFDYSKIVERVESVLEARLSDAYFFWNQDRQISLEERAKQLDKVILHAKIGSLLDKIKRTISLIEVVHSDLNLTKEEFEELKKIIYLSKADLETLMVYEFPELEGIMGYYYALAQGYSESIAIGIRQHYMPRTAEDDLPSTKLGRLASLFEKVSSITAYFGAGLRPTGNEDPYGVRRFVLTLIKLVFQMQESVNLDRIFEQSIKLWGCQEDLKAELEEYFHDRVVNYLSARGIRKDIIEAVWRRWRLDLQRVLKIAKELNAIAKKEEFGLALKVVERTHKITKKAPESLPEVDVSLFNEEEELQLWSAFNDRRDLFVNLVEKGKIKEAVRVYADLYPLLHKFFDNVMVNVEDEAVRDNRLSMLRQINRLFGDKIAVFY